MTTGQILEIVHYFKWSFRRTSRYWFPFSVDQLTLDFRSRMCDQRRPSNDSLGVGLWYCDRSGRYLSNRVLREEVEQELIDLLLTSLFSFPRFITFAVLNELFLAWLDCRNFVEQQPRAKL